MIGKFKTIEQVSQEIENEARKQKMELEWYRFRIEQMALRQVPQAN